MSINIDGFADYVYTSESASDIAADSARFDEQALEQLLAKYQSLFDEHKTLIEIRVRDNVPFTLFIDSDDGPMEFDWREYGWQYEYMLVNLWGSARVRFGLEHSSEFMEVKLK